MKRPIGYISLLILLLVFPSWGTLWSQKTKTSQGAGLQRNAEKGLRDNNHFFFFIASSITNSGTEEEKKMFRIAVQRDFLARLLYMKFRFGESFTEILKSQEILIKIYTSIIEREAADSKKLLNSLAPEIIKSDDYRSRHYLKLGYRSTEEALIMKGMGDNYREKLLSLRLYQYVRAIKKAKYSRRYAILAKLETARPAGQRIKPINGSYSSLLKLIHELIPAEKESYSRMHNDNYYIIAGSKTLYDEVWEKPDLESLPDYKDYQARD